MHFVQLLLPLFNNGEAFPKAYYTALRSEPTEKFEGITTYTRSPAAGFGKSLMKRL